MNESIDNIPKNLNISLIPKDKITYHFVNQPPRFRIPEEEMLKSHAVYLLGSSFIQIPYLLKYFTMGIEYHHIHHTNAKIPGYNLQQYHEEVVSKSNKFDNNKSFMSHTGGSIKKTIKLTL
jgi:hypothetical protein